MGRAWVVNRHVIASSYAGHPSPTDLHILDILDNGEETPGMVNKSDAVPFNEFVRTLAKQCLGVGIVSGGIAVAAALQGGMSAAPGVQVGLTLGLALAVGWAFFATCLWAFMRSGKSKHYSSGKDGCSDDWRRHDN
jgi:hypothetical protein